MIPRRLSVVRRAGSGSPAKNSSVATPTYSRASETSNVSHTAFVGSTEVISISSMPPSTLPDQAFRGAGKGADPRVEDFSYKAYYHSQFLTPAPAIDSILRYWSFQDRWTISDIYER